MQGIGVYEICVGFNKLKPIDLKGPRLKNSNDKRFGLISFSETRAEIFFKKCWFIYALMIQTI